VTRTDNVYYTRDAMDLHGLPAVSAEEQVDDVIFDLRLPLEICIDHLANGRCSVLCEYVSVNKPNLYSEL
jgi:hypothetical protein